MPYIEQNSAPTAALFELIKSLNGPEKRYFKLNASLQKGEKKYLRLFDAIDAQSEYDEEELRERFREETFARQLHVAKRYLYDLILKSLRRYHAGLSVEMRLKDLLADARILYERGLADQCRQILEKGRKLAEQHERELELLEILGLFDRWFPTPIDSDRTIETLLDERRAILRRLENYYEYDALADRISRVVIGSGKPRTQDTEEAFDQLRLHPLLEHEGKALSREALRAYCYIRSTFDYAAGNREEAIGWTMRRLQLAGEGIDGIAADPYNYAAILINLLTLYQGNDHRKFNEYLEKLRSLPDLLEKEGFRSPLLSFWVFSNVAWLELNHLLSLGEFDRAKHLLSSIQEGLADAGRLVRKVDTLRFNYQAAYVFFGVGEYRKALCHLDTVLKTPRDTPRQELLYTARMMELLIYFELNDVTLFDYKVQALRRFLSRRGRLLPVEAILLSALRGLPGHTRPETALDCLRDLYDRLSTLRSDPLEQHAFDYFDYQGWLRSKIDGVSFAAGIRRENTDITIPT